MTDEQVIKDLKVLRDYFKAENDGCAPACLDYAIEAVANQTPEGIMINKTPYGWGNCSECGGVLEPQHKFCWNCGADMRKGGAEE